MEVKIKPLSGCATVGLGCLTLGLMPLFAWLNQRNWPQLVDEQGLTTRKGTRIEWSAFTKMTKVVTRMSGSSTPMAEHYELASPKGKVIVAAYRLENGDQVLDYIWQHLPEQVRVAT